MNKLQINVLIRGKKYVLEFVLWIGIWQNSHISSRYTIFLRNHFSIRADVQRAITMHEDIANVLEKDIQPLRNQPKFEKVCVQAHCERCNDEVITEVDSGSLDCVGIAVHCCFCCCCCLVLWFFNVLFNSPPSASDGYYLCSGFTNKVYKHFCPQCHTVIGEFRTRE